MPDPTDTRLAGLLYETVVAAKPSMRGGIWPTPEWAEDIAARLIAAGVRLPADPGAPWGNMTAAERYDKWHAEVCARDAHGCMCSCHEGYRPLPAEPGAPTLTEYQRGRLDGAQEYAAWVIEHQPLASQPVPTPEPSLRAAMLRMVDETYQTHHTPSSESGPEEWDYTLDAPSIEAVQQALRALDTARDPSRASAEPLDADGFHARMEAILNDLDADTDLPSGIAMAYADRIRSAWRESWAAPPSAPGCICERPPVMHEAHCPVVAPQEADRE